MTALTIETVAVQVGENIKAFRSAAVTSENKGSQAARSMLASLVTGVWTRALAESAIIHAFGNPKSPKSGKPIAKLSGLRDFVGGDAVRKTAETVFRIFDNIDADAWLSAPMPATDEDEATEGVPGARAIRPLVVAFILGGENAPKSLHALNEGVNKALREHAKATQPAADEAEGNGGGEGEGDAGGDTSATATLSLSDRILALMVAYEASTAEERLASHGDFEALVAMVNADIAEHEGEGVTLEQENATAALAA